jgi:hypothetical protein
VWAFLTPSGRYTIIPMGFLVAFLIREVLYQNGIGRRHKEQAARNSQRVDNLCRQIITLGQRPMPDPKQ